MLPIAHVGHWLVYVLYAVPVMIVLGSIVVSMWRDRREDEHDAAAPAVDRGAASSATPTRRAGAPLK